MTGKGSGGDAEGDTYSLIEKVIGSDHNDTLTGGGISSAWHTLQGGLGDDTYVVNNIYVTVAENVGGGTDTIKTSLGTFNMAGVANVENLIYTGTGNFTGTGNDLNNIITGGAGNDTLNGGAGNDTLSGGAGNDTLVGGVGQDTYRYGAGYGNDTIIETSGSSDTDQVRLIDLNPDDVAVSRTGNHLLITIQSTGEILKVQDHFNSTAYGVEQISFADGTLWDRAAILEQVNAMPKAMAGAASWVMEDGDTFLFDPGLGHSQGENIGAAQQFDTMSLFGLGGFAETDMSMATLEEILAEDQTIEDYSLTAMQGHESSLHPVDDFRFVA